MRPMEKHADWVEEFLPKYTDVNKDSIDEILQQGSWKSLLSGS